MCRLFAYVAADVPSAAAELGQSGIDGLLALARLHGDGWGWAGVAHPGADPQVRKSARSAAEDPAFGDVLSRRAAAAALHLRWATPGVDVTYCNAQPFYADGVAFEHNGALLPLQRARDLLSADATASLTSRSDSEVYFTLIREQLAAGASLPDATRLAVGCLRRVFPRSSLNAIVIDRECLVVVHASARSALPEEDLAEMAQVPGLPGHAEDYFAMRWQRQANGTVLVGSSGVTGRDWEPLASESVTTVRLADRSMQTVTLEPELAERS